MCVQVKWRFGNLELAKARLQRTLNRTRLSEFDFEDNRDDSDKVIDGRVEKDLRRARHFRAKLVLPPRDFSWHLHPTVHAELPDFLYVRV